MNLDTIPSDKSVRGAKSMDSTSPPGAVLPVELAVSDPGEISTLRAWLGRIPDIRIVQVPIPPRPGEQGAWDVLSVVAGSSGALTMMLRSLPEFLRSRRSTVSLTIKVADDEVTVTAENVKDVLPVIKSLMEENNDGDQPS